jgi:hypothetical protein
MQQIFKEVIMQEELTGTDYKYSVEVGMLFGFFVGWAIGIVLLLYLGSRELNNWPLVPSIPLFSGYGWAVLGFILGGGGMFAHVGRKAQKPPEKESEALKRAA